MAENKATKTFLFFAVFAVSFIYIVWRLVFTLPLRYGPVAMFFGILLWLSESITVFETFTHFNNARHVVIPEMPVIPDDMFPAVDVFIATHNEPTELLYKTINGCKYMKYPDKRLVHICLCDDKNRPEMRELAEHMGVEYYGLSVNEHAKAGNLNNALKQTHSPLIAIFDADMIPTSDFLLETVPYFFRRDMIKEKDGTWRKRVPGDEPTSEKELGYVQTQQSFYNADPLQRNLFLERNAPNEQDYFYRSVNVARMYTESAAFAGSNTVFSRKALEDVGGLATHSITEDFATSIAVLGKGYRSIAVAKELAHGLSPEDVFSFIKQRQRWSRGAAQGIMTRKFWLSGMPMKAMWNFFISYLYWWTFVRRLVFIMAPILFGLFGLRIADVTLVQLLAVWLPYYVFYNTGLRVMSGGTTSSLWSNTVDAVQFPYMLTPIIAGTIGIPQKKFIVTPKDRQTGKNSHIRLAWPHIILALLCLYTVGVCVYQIFINSYDGAVIVLFWTLYNLFTLFNAIVYYNGRVNSRSSERITAPMPVTIYYNNLAIDGLTADISEGGMAVMFDDPEYLPYDQDIDLSISYNDYHAQMKVRVRQVQQVQLSWKYGLMITDMDEANRREYLQIIFDRDHTFPRVVDIGVAKDLRLVYEGLTYEGQSGERKLARINLEKLEPLKTDSIGLVNVIDFNYKFVLIKRKRKMKDKFVLYIVDDIPIYCKLPAGATKKRKRKSVLYEIENWQELAMDPDFRRGLMELVKPTEEEFLNY